MNWIKDRNPNREDEQLPIYYVGTSYEQSRREFLVYFEDGSMSVVEYYIDKNAQYWRTAEEYSGLKIIAWSVLPKPPKE